MTYKYNVVGSERKALVKAISEFLVLSAIYRGAPTFAYTIGGCTVDKSGTLTFAESVTDDTAALLVTVLEKRGYIPEDIAAEDNDRLEIEVPRAGFTAEALENLRKIIASKETLIKKALGLPESPHSLSFEIAEDKLRFPWFILHGIDGEADAYSRFICPLCKMAKTGHG